MVEDLPFAASETTSSVGDYRREVGMGQDGGLDWEFGLNLDSELGWAGLGWDGGLGSAGTVAWAGLGRWPKPERWPWLG